MSQLIGPVVILTGTARSGKTTVGNLLGSCENAEHIDEPFLPIMLPILAHNGMVPEKLALDMFLTDTVELVYNRYLMRHVNFRPQDHSSVWRQKTPQEIFTRLLGLGSREEVRQYVLEAHPTLVLTLTGVVPFYEFLWKALPDCRVIHMVREGVDVAIDVAEKGWLSDHEHLRPVHADPYRAYTSYGTAYYLPHWLEDGWEERYISSSEFARALHYWRRHMQLAGVGSGDGPAAAMRVMKLKDVLERPRETIESLVKSLGLVKTERTEALLSKISQAAQKEMPIDRPNEIERQELAAVKELYQHLGMPTHRLDGLLLC